VQLNEALAELNKAIAERSSRSRPWWEAMNEDMQ